MGLMCGEWIPADKSGNRESREAAAGVNYSMKDDGGERCGWWEWRGRWTWDDTSS